MAGGGRWTSWTGGGPTAGPAHWPEAIRRLRPATVCECKGECVSLPQPPPA